jgi:serine/threonine-protein kinase
VCNPHTWLAGYDRVKVDSPDPLLDIVIGGRYRVIRKLGEGGMSSVYEAKHTRLHRSFAIKVLLPQLLGNQEAQLRFQREAELLAGLTHPNVVEITDLEQVPDGSACMVLEYLHGGTLRQRLARGPLSWDAIARIGDQAMSALTLAHRNGITHRDLKPDNIFLAIDDVGEESVKLLDFGVSKLRGVGNTTGVFHMLGTPQYMSPEQAQGRTELVGPPTDVWAMGAILYELAAGRPAFPADNLAEVLMKITTATPDPIAAFRPDAPHAFVELLEHALARDPGRRITEIELLRRGLREALGAAGGAHDAASDRTAPGGAQVSAGNGTGRGASRQWPTPIQTSTLTPPHGIAPSSRPPPSGTTAAIASLWTRRRVLWIVAVVAVLVSGWVAAILFAS